MLAEKEETAAVILKLKGVLATKEKIQTVLNKGKGKSYTIDR